MMTSSGGEMPRAVCFKSADIKGILYYSLFLGLKDYDTLVGDICGNLQPSQIKISGFSISKILECHCCINNS